MIIIIESGIKFISSRFSYELGRERELIWWGCPRVAWSGMVT